MLSALRAQYLVNDAEFDRVYPAPIARLSETHFTPVAVARRAAQWLVAGPETRVLDIGAGAGKFCLIGALTTPGTFCGIEQRAHLCDVARATAERHGVPRVHFLHGNLLDVDADSFDAFYLFNPFYEHLEPSCRVDDTIQSDFDCYERYVESTRNLLARARPSTRVATLHGFGGSLPAGYQLERQEVTSSGDLVLWIKTE